LLFGLDALRNGDDIACFGNCNDCLHNGERNLVVRDILDEGLIYLDLVEWNTLQITQRRVPGAEIIQRNVHANLPQLSYLTERCLLVMNDSRLGNPVPACVLAGPTPQERR
jgi:hypothetical protein